MPEHKKKVKLKFTRNKIIFLVVFCILIIFAVHFYFKYLGTRPIFSVNYNGQMIGFRVDLRKADKITVYPNESSVYGLLWNTEIKNITIVYMNTSDMGLTAVQAFEITYKLTIAYKKNNYLIIISAQEVESFENLNTSRETPFIGLLPPSLANETEVRHEDNIIFIKAKTQKEFDLAIAKFIIVALNIKLK